MTQRFSICNIVGAIGISICLSGCLDLDQRRGLNPVLDVASVETASSNKMRLLAALASDAAAAPGSSEYYYEIVEAGFDYVDDQCRSYFSELFFLDRGREQIKSGLTTASQTTAAILGITGATSPSLAIAAQAFGLAANATDIATGTYLYRLPPATTQGFVEKLQLAFRDAAAAKRTQISSPGSAYYLIQRYLNLCLPPTIEAEITKQVSSAGAVVVPTGSGSLFTVESVGKDPASVSRSIQKTSIQIFKGPKASPGPPGPRLKPPPTSDPRYTKVEQGLFESTIKCWQIALGVQPVDMKLGDHQSATRAAIRQYLISKGALSSSDASNESFEIKGRREVGLLEMLNRSSSCY